MKPHKALRKVYHKQISCSSILCRIDLKVCLYENLAQQKRRTSYALFPILSLILSGCSSDRAKIFGPVGDKIFETLGDITEASPPVSTIFTIDSVEPLSSQGDGSESLPIQITGAVVASPIIRGYPLLDLKFLDSGTIDFTNIEDVQNISLTSSSAPVDISNLDTELDKIFVSESQSGDWKISFQPKSFGTLYLDWTNNTSSTVSLDSLTLDEVGQFAFKNSGEKTISITLLNLDEADTQRIEIGNDGDGNIIFGADSNLTGTSALRTISLTTWNDGDILLGTPGTSGLPELPQLVSIAMIASQTGNITLGDLASTTPINKLNSISISTEGANINIGSINAKQIQNFFISAAEFSNISIGDIATEEIIGNMTLSGAGDISMGAFSGEANITIDASNMTKNGVSLNFSSVTGTIDATTTDLDDQVSLGIAGGKVVSGDGDDTITVAAEATGNSDIRTGNGIDLINLSNTKGIDIVDPGGTEVGIVDGSATEHTNINGDKIVNFDPIMDKIALSSITATSSNFLSETDASSFSDALDKSNGAMELGKSFYLSYNVAGVNDGFGLLFSDTDGDGISDFFITLVGATTDSINHENIVIA